MAPRDITEGRSGRSIAVDLGVVSNSATWTNTAEAFDVAVGGQPFIYAISDARPYQRVTAPYQKEKFDNSIEPGEQTLTGWWIRSQSSFHTGTGIKFYDPSAGETVLYRFADSTNVDVWTKGQVTLLKETANLTGVTTGIYKIKSIMNGTTNKILAWTVGATALMDYTAAGTVVTYSTTGRANIVDVTTDGSRVFVADDTRIFVGNISDTAAMTGYYTTGSSKIVIEWVKQRLVACIGASVYELTGAVTPTALPTALYTHPNSAWEWTSITESGSAIYTAGYAGGISAIYKFTLSVAGAMPILTSGVVAARLPYGEIVNRIEDYLGYLIIGTSKGVRIANISDQDGSISYGPLVIEASNTGLDFAFRDRFIYVTGTVATFAGLYRIDLGNEIENLRFAYATDANFTNITGHAISVDFVGNTDQIAFATSGSNGIAIQSTSTLAATGSLTTGNIRYGTLEPKNFKRLIGRGVFTAGGLTLNSVTSDGTVFDHIEYNVGVPSVEVATSQPQVAQEFIAYRFDFARDATTTSTGPIFKGYQAKSTIATPRQRVIKFPVYCFDIETDRYNTLAGYEGRAQARINALELIEAAGDVITWQDLTTGESLQAIIEQVAFTRMTPPDKRFDGFGGILDITIRTV